ncbi:MAG: DUF3786 domain-containing protein [Deltaproteobacteria bacterium]|nr:DUF3786 domain-containing protein [Deltaproteobacteria bacterium]
MEKAAIFDEIYRGYLNEIANLDLTWTKDNLGLILEKGETIIPFYGTPYRISAQGIVDQQGDRPPHSICVILCKYLLLCPEKEPAGSDWVSYKEFKEGAPFFGGFLNNAEKPISRTFSGRLSDLRQASVELGGRPLETAISADLVLRFEALPKVPVLIVFNDQDDDFPAHCSLLFERRAEKYLDMECLAMVGWVLTDRLCRHFKP